MLEKFGCVVGIADCSFGVEGGEIFCVMGLSGSGKSTMVRHLNRLIEPTAGQITVLGRDVINLPGVNFQSGSDLLLAGAERLIQDLAATLIENDYLTIEVAGHTDDHRLSRVPVNL